jgi:hypothetical protein
VALVVAAGLGSSLGTTGLGSGSVSVAARLWMQEDVGLGSGAGCSMSGSWRFQRRVVSDLIPWRTVRPSRCILTCWASKMAMHQWSQSWLILTREPDWGVERAELARELG